jgi:hypothetical protein
VKASHAATPSVDELHGRRRPRRTAGQERQPVQAELTATLAGLSSLEKAAEAAAGVVDDACEPLTAHAPALLVPNDTPWDPAGTVMPVGRHRC